MIRLFCYTFFGIVIAVAALIVWTDRDRVLARLGETPRAIVTWFSDGESDGDENYERRVRSAVEKLSDMVEQRLREAGDLEDRVASWRDHIREIGQEIDAERDHLDQLKATLGRHDKEPDVGVRPASIDEFSAEAMKSARRVQGLEDEADTARKIVEQLEDSLQQEQQLLLELTQQLDEISARLQHSDVEQVGEPEELVELTDLPVKVEVSR